MLYLFNGISLNSLHLLIDTFQGGSNMRSVLFFLILGSICFYGAAQAAEKIVNCPRNSITVDVRTNLSNGWWSTPQSNAPLVEVRMQNIGGESTMVCLYRAYGDARIAVMHTVPKGFHRCRAAGRHFVCTSASFSGQPHAPGKSAICRNSVQGKIAWNYNRDTRWAENNIQRLCRGAEDSREPARCFSRVMHGGINWGGGTRWKWENALQLCAGSRNASATISCFQSSRKKYGDWQRAIRACVAR
jgi:hypothetical protein